MSEPIGDQLAIPRCDDCAHWAVPGKSRCPSCWSEAVHNQLVSGAATLFTATTVAVEGRKSWVGLAELLEQPGLRILAEFALPLDSSIFSLMDSPVQFAAYRREGLARVPVFTSRAAE